MNQTSNLRIALQKKGKLAEGSIELLRQCGLNISLSKSQLLIQDFHNQIDFIFTRDDDIPHFLQDEVCDLGLFGRNLLDEFTLNQQQHALEILMPLGFAPCRLSIAVPLHQNYSEVVELNGKSIATSYPATLKNFLDQKKIQAKIVPMHGSVELAPSIAVADCICDLVSSGTTLRENGLKEMLTIAQSEALLVAGPSAKNKKAQIDRLMLRMRGVLQAQQNKYIMLHLDANKLETLKRMLPGCESPTVLPLQGDPQKVAVHVVSREEVFWETIEALKSIGATSILVLPIEKMVY